MQSKLINVQFIQEFEASIRWFVTNKKFDEVNTDENEFRPIEDGFDWINATRQMERDKIRPQDAPRQLLHLYMD